MIGIGAGDPRQVTTEAIEALNATDVIFELERSTADLTRARSEIVRRYLPRAPHIIRLHEPRRDRAATAYETAVRDWRAGRADVWEQAIQDHVPVGRSGAFLVWGDPSLYDSTIAVLEEILARGRLQLSYEVIPGISSLHALTARHRIPLNRVGGAVLITTGRRLATHGIPPGIDDVVVMLDGSCAFQQVKSEPLDVYWGAYLGTEDEILLSGPLVEVADEIERVRARARARKGWIMDLYLLRRH